MVQQIMLALHCKKADAVDLKTPIWEYISNTYSPDQARGLGILFGRRPRGQPSGHVDGSSVN